MTEFARFGMTMLNWNIGPLLLMTEKHRMLLFMLYKFVMSKTKNLKKILQSGEPELFIMLE